MEMLHKRMKATEGSEGDGRGGGGGGGDAAVAHVGEEEGNNNVFVSEEMEANIQAILQSIERFNQQVSELLEAGKAMFREVSAEFEERLISIHQEHMDKWQEEMKELRMLDSSNEAARALLHNAHFHLLHNVRDD